MLTTFTGFDPFRTGSFGSSGPFGSSGTFGSGVPFDVVRFDDRFEVHIDLPGVDASTIDVTVDARNLTLTAERSRDLPDGATLVSKGRPSGSIRRSFHLGERLDTAGLTADYADGVLTVTIPVAETAKPRKISVGGAPEAALEAAATETA